MSIDFSLVIYAVVILATTVVGIVLGSWLNSKLLMRSGKGEIVKIIKDAFKTEEYKTAMELISNLNDLLKSDEAKNFFTNASKLLVQMTGTPENKDSIFVMPSKTSKSSVPDCETAKSKDKGGLSELEKREEREAGGTDSSRT